MGETFLININCSKILSDKDETQYTMFIDITKMSIVYELVEWIRWMFSFESCLYLTHNNSVIHELEDIQLLSKLKTFEVKPCGGSQCVHKKMYRTLLKNLKLFVNWNGTEVHKYFLHKLSQMDQKLSQKNGETSPKIFNNNYNIMDFKNTGPQTESPKNNSPMNNTSSLESKFDGYQNGVLSKTSKSFCDTIESKVKPDKPIVSGDAVKKNIQNFLQDNYDCMNSDNQTANEAFYIPHTVFNYSPEKNKPKIVKRKQSEDKSSFKKYVKPFSLGEILSNIREDFEKQNIDVQESTPISNVSMFEEENFDEKVNGLKNSFVSEDEASGGKKRKRIRKRKKAKKQHEEVDSVLSVSKNDNSQYSFDFVKTSTNQKPSHIRFDAENEDNRMETECLEAELSTRNGNECSENQIKDNPGSTFTKKEPEKVMMVTSYDESKLSDRPENNSVTQYITTNGGEYSSATENQVIPEDKLIDIDDKVLDNTSHCLSPTKSIQSKNYNPDLATVFSLKEKFKNAVVIERFY